jgi:hypothetical protein
VTRALPEGGALFPIQEKFLRRNENSPLLLEILMLYSKGWRKAGYFVCPLLSNGTKPKRHFTNPYLAPGKFIERWKTQ